MKPPPAPKHLRASGRGLWSAVADSWTLEAHHYVILRATCEAADRCEDARLDIEANGLTVTGRFGTKANPSVTIERDSRIALLRGIRELGLDLEDVKSSRPPSRFDP